MKTTNTTKLFTACCIALTATSMTFAIRANLVNDLGTEFSISSADMGLVNGTAFWGFTLSMLIGGFLYDLLGIRKMLVLAFVGHLAGVFLTIFASGFWSLFISTLFIGLANGMVEAACNPLVARLYPDQKTKKLNQFHVWFPGGIVIGGLLAFGLGYMSLTWHWQVALILIPTIIYGFMFLTMKMPEEIKEVKNSNTGSALKACASPLFILMVICMLFTAATELGTGQWIVALLENVGVHAILLLVFINGLMAVGRSFAGEIERKLSPTGMLLFSAIFASIGLYLLGNTAGNMTFVAAGVFAVGVCFFWPTMLGFVSEYTPKTGAIGMSIMGAAGMLSVSLILPLMGNLYDHETQTNLPEAIALKDALSSEAKGVMEIVKSARLKAGSTTLELVALMPIVLTVIFSLLFLNRKRFTGE